MKKKHKKKEKETIIGILAFHGDVAEHISALERAARAIKKPVSLRLVRTRDALRGLSALVIPGGESTTLQKLIEREGMVQAIQELPAVFGTCAGAILLAQDVEDAAKDQRTLALMDIKVKRNAYGRQQDSFEKDIETVLGPLHAVFIRAPQISRVGKNVEVLAKSKNGVLACEEKSDSHYYLAAAFHPELTTSVFHEHFLKNVV